MEPIISEIQAGLMDGDAQYVKEKTEQAIKLGITANKIIKIGLMPGMKTIGEKFRAAEIFIPDVLMASRAMHASLYVLKPFLTKSRYHKQGIVVVGTVAGDLHDLGKNMVSMMLEGAGYKVFDVGIDVPVADFVKAVDEYKPDVLALSALLTTTMGEISEVIKMSKADGHHADLKILVGGGPVTPDFARAIGADAYAATSFHAIEAVNRLITGEVGFISVS